MQEQLKIEIKLNTLNKRLNLLLDCINSKAIFNGKEIAIDLEGFCSKVLQIVSAWDSNMINRSSYDGLRYSVTIFKEDKKCSYVGKNKYPENFDEFIALLKDASIW